MKKTIMFIFLAAFTLGLVSCEQQTPPKKHHDLDKSAEHERQDRRW